ncbi:SacI homology domain-containing protein [Xylariaceae sp. FL0255]|nr:SacI homology domain-containing protein [Xylariaceae sp. FL0255]
MPGLARKLLICAAVDGVIIQQLPSNNGQRRDPVTQVKYTDATVSKRELDPTTPSLSFEAFGILGVFTVSRLSYLVAITGRQEVAQIRGYPIYKVTDVAITPCTSRSEAETAIRFTSNRLRKASAESTIDDSDTESEAEPRLSIASADDAEDPGALSDRETAGARDPGKRDSISEDVFKRSGSYGRFAQRWFNNKDWMANRRRSMGLSGIGNGAAAKQNDEMTKQNEDEDLGKTVLREGVNPPPAPTAGESLIPKLLRMAHIWFGSSGSFFFSYDLDLTRSITDKTITDSNLSLHERADSTYFWNSNLLKPFIVSKNDALALPVIQGFVGQKSFTVDRHPPQVDSQLDSMELDDMTPGMTSPPGSPKQERASPDFRSSEKEYTITVVSRRSTKRAGLRYLRRGIDDEGYTANSVETEQILSTAAWEQSANTYSFVQVRGSIPLFFTQSPYSLKPVPVLQHSPEANFRAFSKHFDRLRDKYDQIQVVNLVEKHGVEAIVGNQYQTNTEKYNAEKAAGSLAFEWFDFHSACRGMKFENVSLLLDTLSKKIEAMGSTVETNGAMKREQSGVIRTNCMDCLDRTNVCQSFFGKYMLDLQLKEEGFDMASQRDQTNSWFNELWADNGDAISKQYASTAAMKGDYTRTRKRDYRGMINDIGLSMTRYYNGMVNDHFSQAAIDFFLGNVTSLVFEEFESTMRTKDPGMSMSKMREQAIETSQKIAIEAADSEDFIGGWTLLSPSSSEDIKGTLEESVLLLTDAALYLCRFDWNLDKVSSFERVDLSHVIGIKIGTFITSTLSSAQTDETKNFGMVITYEPGKTNIERTNTRSLSSVVPAQPAADDGDQKPRTPSVNAPAAASSTQKVVLKALYAHTAISDARGGTAKMTEVEQVNLIAAEIERLALASQPPAPDHGANGSVSGEAAQGGQSKSLIEKGDIVSLAEARKSTGLFEQLGHSIKKLVWA